VNASGAFDDKYKHKTSDIISRIAMYSSHYIEDVMIDLLNKYTEIENITFAQVKEKYGTTLIIPGTSTRNSLQSIYMTYETHPDTPIARAIRASSSIPLMFEPVNIGSDKLMDGGVTDAYVVKEMQNYLSLDELLFLSIDYFKLASDRISTFKKILQQSYGGLFLLWRMKGKNKFTKEEKQRMIPITCHDCPLSINFFITESDRQKIYESGIKSTELYLSGHENN